MSKALNIGVIGLGSIGARHIRNLRVLYPRAEIEILTKRTKWETTPRTKLIASTETFFAKKHDIYFITNETDKHIDTLLKCLAQKPAGIFVEKPLSHALKGLKRVSAITKKQGT